MPNPEKALDALVLDQNQPAIARATALTLLPDLLTSASLPAVKSALGNGDALVRRAAAGALEPMPPQERVALAAPLLSDPIRSVRIEAARILAGTPPDLLQPGQNTALDRAIAELIVSEMATA